MKLMLQFGHGMLALSEELIKKWGGGTVILSPRDLKKDQMLTLQKKLAKNSGEVLLDPQFFLPRSNHDKLTAHDFWPDSYSTENFFNSGSLRNMLSKLYSDYNRVLETKEFILPGLFIENINDDWFNIHEMIINSAIALNPDIPLIATICISAADLISQEKIHSLLEKFEEWDVDGFYVVPQHPKDSYLADAPNWLLNLLDLCAGIKLLNKKVIVGYSNHQSLILGLAKVDYIASGTWLNVRTFSEGRFNNPEDSFAQRSTWYYCPQALSEYQIPFLSIAHSQGFLDQLKTNEIFGSDYTDILFRGADPSTVNFSEREAFRHYLQCLKYQADNIVKDDFNSTFNSLKLTLEAASNLSEYFFNNGVRGKYRDFSSVADATISAVDVFKNIRGLVYSNAWTSL